MAAPGILSDTAVGRQLLAAGVVAYLHESAVHPRDDGTLYVRGRADPGLLAYLSTHERFKTGIGAALHPWVGPGRKDFRGIRGTFGPGSLQVVFSPITGRVEADIDDESPYDDLVGLVVHNVKVLWARWRRWRQG